MVFNLFRLVIPDSKVTYFLKLTTNGKAKCFQVISVSLCDTVGAVKPICVLRGVELFGDPTVFWQFDTLYFRAAIICKPQPHCKYFLGHL